jgi:prepilin-type processing-associated H-X9-DG protein/prepilin-type N-terminal cleavage/methylation domain-containing protein
MMKFPSELTAMRQCPKKFLTPEVMKLRFSRRFSRRCQPVSFLTSVAAVGFTVIELLVVIAVIALLAVLLLPALSRAKVSACSAACKSNLRQIGIVLRLYVNDFERYPRFHDVWAWYEPSPLAPYYGSSQIAGIPDSIFRCPASLGGSYAYNATGTAPRRSEAESQIRLGLGQMIGWGEDHPFVREFYISESQVRMPSDMIAFLDGVGNSGYGFGWPGLPESGHSDRRSNAVFCDGHVESSDPKHIPKKVKTFANSAQTEVAFVPNESHAKRWNNDNEPHRETWPQN